MFDRLLLSDGVSNLQLSDGAGRLLLSSSSSSPSTSDYLENAILNHVFGKATYSPPTIYVALCTAAPTDSDTGSTITEASYTGYARVATSAGDWAVAAVEDVTNANAIIFAECTGGSSNVTHLALCDAISGGNLLCYAELNIATTISSGQRPRFPAGAIDTRAD